MAKTFKERVLEVILNHPLIQHIVRYEITDEIEAASAILTVDNKYIQTVDGLIFSPKDVQQEQVATIQEENVPTTFSNLLKRSIIK